MADRDTIQRFIFERFPVRGKLVHLDSSWREVLGRHPYPPLIREALGEAMAATSLLVATLKLDGALTLQLQGEGPLKLLVVRCTSGMALRGLARWEGEVPEGSLAAMTGEGRLAVTLESRAERNRYQSIVPLAGHGIADCLQGLFCDLRSACRHACGWRRTNRVRPDCCCSACRASWVRIATPGRGSASWPIRSHQVNC